MKQRNKVGLFLIAVMVIASIVLFNKAQAQEVPPKCKAITKAGQPCKVAASEKTGFCYFHSPGITCGARTKAGTPCKIKVKKQGDKCRHHAPSENH